MAYMYLPSDNKQKGTITLLHGKNFTSAYWQDTALLLNSLGYEVLIPDQIGFGKSSKPLNYQYTFETLALNTKKLLASLNIDSTQIIAHSMGGMLASRFSLMYSNTINKLLNILNFFPTAPIVPARIPAAPFAFSKSASLLDLLAF